MQYAIENLMQTGKLVASITDRHYIQNLNLLSGASIGQHVRHIIEFYQCLQDGYPRGVIDYNKRNRSIRLETETDYTLTIITGIIGFLERASDKSLIMKLDDVFGQSILAHTSLYRELAYNLDHTIHHQAIIKIGMQELMPHYTFSENFGLAPSTRRYMENSKQ